MGEPKDITRILSELSGGDANALDRLIPVVYDELRAIARNRLRSEGDGLTLQTTALVHEAYLRMVGIEGVELRDRAHFFAICARVMRRVLLDHGDWKRAQKRGGGAPVVQLSEQLVAGRADPPDLLALYQALERLEQMDERSCRVVECRFFAGLSIEETAMALDLSPATVKREWASARAWLNRELAS